MNNKWTSRYGKMRQQILNFPQIIFVEAKLKNVAPASLPGNCATNIRTQIRSLITGAQKILQPINVTQESILLRN